MTRADLLAEARAVLERNWTGTFTRPGQHLYPHQWSWDSAFAAIGNTPTNAWSTPPSSWPPARGIREYFDPCSGEGYGSRDFSWTAALVANLLTGARPAS